MNTAIHKNVAASSSKPCPACSSAPREGRLESLGLAPSSLERGPTHSPDCPLLNPKRPLRKSLTPALVLALAGGMVGNCGNNGRAREMPPGDFGLDSGTISAVERPAQLERTRPA